MMEGIGNIELSKRLDMEQGKSQNRVNGDWLHYWTEGFMTVNARSLMKTFGHKASFVLVYQTM